MDETKLKQLQDQILISLVKEYGDVPIDGEHFLNENCKAIWKAAQLELLEELNKCYGNGTFDSCECVSETIQQKLGELKECQ